MSNTDELPGFVSSKYREGERGRRGKQDIPDSDLRSETLMIIIKNMYLFRRTYSESFHDRVFFSRKEKKGGVCAKQRICRDVDVVGMSSVSVCTPTFFRGFLFLWTRAHQLHLRIPNQGFCVCGIVKLLISRL